MNLAFRKHHLFSIFELWGKLSLPLDVFLSQYFRLHKAVGAQDRRYLSETIYKMVRWQGLLDYFSTKPISWQSRYEAYTKTDLLQTASDLSIPLHIRASFPKELFQLLSAAHGEEKAFELCLISNTEAPTTVRVNSLKTTREALFSAWKDLYPVSCCNKSIFGIVFHKRINFFAMQEFKDGLFEIQDEASQLIAHLVQAQKGQKILDFCSGSGGKTLAFAPSLRNTGQIYLHDIREKALEEARKRLQRAGIQNAQFLYPQDPKKQQLKEKMHWVLVDAPCSGSGTWRRNPDMKWKFSSSMLEELVEKQREIFKEALYFLHPEGRIVYATCSLFPQENEAQASYFQEKYHLTAEGLPFHSFPKVGEMDGFFGIVLKKSMFQN